MKKGQKVSWNWGAHRAHGTIVQRFVKPVTRILQGTEVHREASSKEPAFLIEQADKDKILKSASELTVES